MIHIIPSSLNQITEIFNKRKKAIGLEKYSVGELLDHGGMSNVYRLTDSKGNTDYVLRVSEEHKSSYSHDIFNVREMEILRELKKNSMPHVVQYLDAFVVDIPGEPRYYCSVMKFLRTLKQYRVQGDGVEIAVRLGCDFLPLLQSLMEKEIIHRDIKPENIFYDGDFRNDEGFLLGDFGIAKHDTETTATATGTETTMAPEVRGLDRSLGKDRTYSDMYSLGIVMYRYLNQGVYPSNRERIERIPPDKNPFPLPRNGSKRLKALVVKATSYNPRDRFESPQAMLRELQQCEEYSKYIFDDSGDENATVDASAPISEEIVRLRRELAEKEKERVEQQKQIEQLKKQAAEYERDRKRESSANRLFSGNSTPPSPSKPASLSVGDHFTFGRYPQGASGEVQPIKWRVLAVKNGRALVISEKLLDCVQYNETDTDVTWETCTLRKWMNNDFISKGFSSNAQANIATVIIQNPNNPFFGTKGGNATQDKIFALSIDEAEKYFGNDDERMAEPTDYAKKQRCYVSNVDLLPNGEKTGWWWLRSPGNYGNVAVLVFSDGHIYHHGSLVYSNYVAVRPAFWLNL